ncbi:hypothetical protein JCM3263A_00290 [Thermobifida fusca]|uniref:Methyl-accepting chemotaxis protein n=2 Tax=Thermobifida fusca TaxID=2021 RepID=A0A9P2T9U5_THEFU|nr:MULTISPECIES: hypothetical protein [Thermobifida]AAZ56110.1 hypothetical protein Tfu_2077 [Thermobifida fusca YX]EOR70838.1 hypothetical protein TM51_10682 [Thermobifida fusca TM51]MBO2530185.1 hypothetical protein [Thermobifida sp.]MDD6792057.1 hypothetical protein [Thermobifida fusca]PPS94366.1 hypothetical protein BH05_05870 [Thermobifida fusca]
MSTSNSRAHDLAAIAEQLDRHASTAPPASAQLLRSLARSLADGGADLAATDLVAAYPPDSLMPDLPPPRWMSLLLWLLRGIRDVLIFLPVFWTWYQLMQVLSAFSDAPEGANFLYGWQQGGFTGTGQFEPLSTTALWVCIFLLGVIGATLLVHLLEGITDALSDRSREREEITQLLALATYLIPDRPDSMRTEIRGASETLQGIRRAMAGMENALSAATDSMHGAAADMRQAADGIAEALAGDPREQLIQALDEWQTRMGQLADAVREARTPAELLESLTTLTHSAVEGQERFGEQTRRILELLQQQTTLVERSITESAQFATDTMDRVTAALEKLERVSEELATAQDKLGAFTEQSSNTLRRAVDEFTALSDELAFFIKTVQHDVTRRRNEELVGGREEDSWS